MVVIFLGHQVVTVYSQQLHLLVAVLEVAVAKLELVLTAVLVVLAVVVLGHTHSQELDSVVLVLLAKELTEETLHRLLVAVAVVLAKLEMLGDKDLAATDCLHLLLEPLLPEAAAVLLTVVVLVVLVAVLVHKLLV
jgi:hypothetical protein